MCNIYPVFFTNACAATTRPFSGDMSLVNDLWTYRGLVGNLAQRELKGRYKRSVLGWLWSLLNPAATLGTYAFVCFAWIFFRAPSWDKAMEVMARITSGSVSLANISPPIVVILVIALLGHYLPPRWWQFSQDRFAAAPFYAQAVALFALILGLQYINATGAAPFIYTKF